MKQPEDRATVDWVGGETGKGGGAMAAGSGKARMVQVLCRACRYSDRLVLQSWQGTPECPKCAAGGFLAELGGLPAVVLKTSSPRGAYRGAVKIGCDNHAARAATGKSQAEFAALAGVSERTLRTWESGELVSQASTAKISAALDQHTGESRAGRGLMPKRLRVRLAGGPKLADFERPT